MLHEKDFNMQESVCCIALSTIFFYLPLGEKLEKLGVLFKIAYSLSRGFS